LAECSPAEGFNTGIPEAEQMLQNLDRFSHHFVLACLMDRQIKAERAWAVPYWIGAHAHVGGWDFPAFEKLDLRTAKKIFKDRSLHRFNDKMPEIFVSGIRQIAKRYDGVAKNIWSGNPHCARVIRRFLEFDGAGPKIATMATNILIRQFKIPMTDRSAIDISGDVQVMKYFVSHKLLRSNAKREELIYLAREIYPAYPGLLDLLAWEHGRAIRARTKKSN
jgi:hypothetical protein